MNVYEKVIVIGYGKITGEIIRLVHRYQEEYEYTTIYIEHEAEVFGTSRKICTDLDIDCYKIEDKKELTAYFQSLAGRCLIISASNNYLFPKILTENPQHTILNFHNALLPKFPGRNAPSWAIFEGERETGITWHYVTEQVDGGDIIVQKKCRIDSDIRAYELAEKLMQLAFEEFCEKFSEIIEDRVIAIKQQVSENRKIYKSTDCPGNGTFRMEDSPEYIYRLLRAVDYGKYGIFPQVTVTYQGKKVKIVRYSRIPKEKMEEKQGRWYLPLDTEYVLSLSWVEIKDDDEFDFALAENILKRKRDFYKVEMMGYEDK